MIELSNLLSLLAVLAGAAAFLELWALVVRRFYRVRGTRPDILRGRCADGWQIAVYHRAAPRRQFQEPVLLCHGLAANHYNFDFEPPHSLSHALSEAGLDCFTVEWRGTGASRRAPRGRCWAGTCADDHIRFDGPALLELALQRTGAAQAFWLGHSLGGLIGLAVAQSQSGQKLKGLVTLGAPVFFKYSPLLSWALRAGAIAAWPCTFRQELLSAALAPFLGYAALPLSDVIANPRNIRPRLQRKVYAQLVSSVSRRMLLQLRDWVTHDAFRSLDLKIDYRLGLSRVSTPVLMMGGSSDRLAPPASIRSAFDLLGSSDKTLIMFGRESGDREEYGHGDLIFGEGAPQEIFPKISSWLKAHATPLPSREL